MSILAQLDGQARQEQTRAWVRRYHAKGMHISALQAIIASNEGESVSVTELELARDYVRRAQIKENANDA